MTYHKGERTGIDPAVQKCSNKTASILLRFSKLRARHGHPRFDTQPLTAKVYTAGIMHAQLSTVAQSATGEPECLRVSGQGRVQLASFAEKRRGTGAHGSKLIAGATIFTRWHTRARGAGRP